MKYIILFSSLILLSCATTSKINTVEYQSKITKVVAKGDSSGLNEKLVVTCYNRFFNEAKFGKKFISDNYLTLIDYKKSMLVEIFLGKSTIKKSIENIRIQENRNNLQVFYDITESETPPYGYSPYIIIQTGKSRKPIQYFENGVLLGGSGQNIYVK